MYVTRYGSRFWAVYEDTGEDAQTLVCVTVYRKGAREVVRRLKPPASSVPNLHVPSSGPGDEPGPAFRQRPTPREENPHDTDHGHSPD